MSGALPNRRSIRLELAGAALSLELLVWRDGHQTKLSYTPPAVLAGRYGLSDDLAGELAAIDAVTDAVISE